MKKVTNTLEESKRNPEKMLLDAMIHPDDHVERMEKRGQEEFVESDVFPVDLGHLSNSDFEELGFKFHGPVPDDPLFQFATLPEGWDRVGTDHDMWSTIEDENGVERVAIFYKAAFYDRRARASIPETESE